MIKRYTLILLLIGIGTQAYAQERILTKLIVGNEGNFTRGNATLTEFLPATQTATQGVFSTANQGNGIGDVVQSMAVINGDLYVVVNNSARIAILDSATYQQKGIIETGDGSSPREIVAISETKAYVTDLNNFVYIVDLENRTVSNDVIPAGIQSDKMILTNGIVYVANSSFGNDSTLFAIDPVTDTVIDTVVVARGPASMQVDSNGLLWVVCTGFAGVFDSSIGEFGGFIPGTSRPGGLYAVSTTTREVVVQAELASAREDIAVSEDGQFVYVNSGGIRAFNTSTLEFLADTLIPGNFNSFTLDDAGSQFYLANARDFSSSGEVVIYSESGEQLSSFDTGIIPGNFLRIYGDGTSTTTESDDQISGFNLAQNYPNPFNPTTQIEYTVPQSGLVRLTVYSSAGQKIVELVNGIQSQGTHSVQFNGAGLASGLYIYQIQYENRIETNKMILLK
ncbi:MAG: DUF5074 domain-containing protein [Bacteroidota bacterium]